MKSRNLIIAVIAIVMLATSAVSVSAASKKVDKLVMTAKTSCNMYTSKSTASKYKAGQLRYAEEFTVSGISGSWAKIKYNSKTRYVKKGNLSYQKYMIKNSSVYMRTKASGTSKKVTALYCGNTVTSYGTKKGSDGKLYMYCKSSSGKKGYIPVSSVKRATTAKTVKVECKYYKLPFKSSDKASLKKAAGTIPDCTQVNAVAISSSWTKIQYNSKPYYIYTKNTENAKKYTINSKTALRKKPNGSSSYYSILYWNTPVTVLSEHTIGGTKWLRCKANGYTGFIRSSHLSSNLVSNVKSSTSLYKKPDTGSSNLKTVVAGSSVKILYKGNSWSKVSYSGKTGYIPNGRFVAAEYQLNGKVYTTSKNMYNGISADTVSEKVTLIASSSDKKTAYVKTGSNKYYYTKWASLSDITINEKAYIYKNYQYIYNSPDSSGEIAFSLPYMTEITLVKEVSSNSSGGWYLIKYNGKQYYTWLDSEKTQITDQKKSYDYTGKTQYHQAVIDLALEICNEWKTEHISGGENTITADGLHGFDCSGFVAYVLNTTLREWNPAINLSSNVETLYYTEYVQNKGLPGEFAVTHTTLDKAEPGDVIFFNDDPNDSKYIDHCGIYIGNGEFIHSTGRSTPGNSVCIMPLRGEYKDDCIDVVKLVPSTIIPANTEFYTTKNLYLYENMAFVEDERLRLVTSGETVNMLYYNSTGTWSYVETTDGLKGFIQSKYIEKAGN